MANWVLVHGAAHGGWCWEWLTPRLETRGHVVHAPDLPGAGDDPMPPGQVTLADCVTRVREVVERSADPVMLLAHSMGGVTACEVAEACPEAVAGVVYVAAFMLRSGERARDVTLSEPRSAMLDAIDFDADPARLSYVYRPGPALRLFYHDCDPAIAAEALRRLRPMPRAIAQTAVRWSAERAGGVPRAYVQCAADRAIPLHLQQAMCERLPPARLLRMDCGHAPFMAEPDALAAHLHALAGSLEAAR